MLAGHCREERGDLVIGVSSGRPRTVRSGIAAALLVGLGGALLACSAGSDDAGRTTSAPSTVTTLASVVDPPPLSASAPSKLSSGHQVPLTESGAPSGSEGEVSPAESDVNAPAEPVGADVSPTAVANDVGLADAPASQEAADRSAIEAQWIRFWTVSLDMTPYPQSDWDRIVGDFAVDPIKTGVIQTAAKRELTGVRNYGGPVHKLFWQLAIRDGNTATIADCQDQSAAGTVNSSTGVKSEPGGSEVNLRGNFVRGGDGIWRLSTVVELGGIACPAL